MLVSQKLSIPYLPLSLPSHGQVAMTTCVDPPAVEEGLIFSLFQSLSPHKSMGLDVIQAKALREISDNVAKPLSIIFEKGWRVGYIPYDWKRQNVTGLSASSSALRRTQEITGPLVLL